MKQYLLLTSALVVSGLLSGVAEAACIQTPTCSSLGYTSSSACTGGVKCPFGNAWNCTGPNNTTKINSINTSITNILNRLNWRITPVQVPDRGQALVQDRGRAVFVKVAMLVILFVAENAMLRV